VYDFELNHNGIIARILKDDKAKMPGINHTEITEKINLKSSDHGMNEKIFIKTYGFDIQSHEHMKNLLREGKIGLAENRLPSGTRIQDVSEDEILHFREDENNTKYYSHGIEALKRNEFGVVTFAGGMGSRWTRGAAVVKPVNPFVWMEGKHRTFLEIHIAKSRNTASLYGCKIPHIFTTSYLTHEAVSNFLKRFHYFNYREFIHLSSAKTIGHRVYPMERDLQFSWKEQLHQKLDEHLQRVQDNQHRALIDWTRSRGQGEDYSENKYILRFNPPGHWYEIPNLMKNGVLAHLLSDNPNLKYLFCHNIDTIGAYIEPALLGMHIAEKSCMTFEVIPKLIDDKGGGLAKINGHKQIIEGLALPRQEDEYALSYYNTLTHLVTIDSLLAYFHLDRKIIIDAENDPEKKHIINNAIRSVENKMPTYVTLKNVKYLWGSGQEDVYPVAQFEKLWGDMTDLRDLKVSYIEVSRHRGQQLKEPSQLDRWFVDGSFEYVREKTKF
jgi:UDP-N-acetylglucosamine pyrophosphorylase